jgi:hypothetical protein
MFSFGRIDISIVYVKSVRKSPSRKRQFFVSEQNGH